MEDRRLKKGDIVYNFFPSLSTIEKFTYDGEYFISNSSGRRALQLSNIFYSYDEANLSVFKKKLDNLKGLKHSLMKQIQNIEKEEAELFESYRELLDKYPEEMI